MVWGIDMFNVAHWALLFYGILAAIVKFAPTLNKGTLLEIIKFLGNFTNRQTDDAAIRAQLNSVPFTAVAGAPTSGAANAGPTGPNGTV